MTIIDSEFMNGGKIIKIKNSNETNNYNFFSSGSYGCTMFPNMKCDGKKSNKKYPKHMSKLSVEGFYSNNEYSIGQKLLELQKRKTDDSILNHMNFMLNKCQIKRKKININTNKYDCSILDSEKYENTNDFVLFQMNYIPSKEASKYLHKNFNIKLLLRYYFFVLKCIQFLSKQNIIHHDLHMSNVLVDENKDFHLIDFGIAIDYTKCFKNNKLNMDYIKNILIVFDPTWEYWPVEYHILCYFVFKQTKLTNKELENIINSYYNKNKTFNHYFKNMKNYKKNVFDFYSEQYVNQTPIEIHIENILEESHNTWDIYQINYIFLVLIQLYKIENMDNVINLCKIGIHYNYHNRYNVEFYINNLISILKNNKKSNYSIYNTENISTYPLQETFDSSVNMSQKILTY